MYGVNRGEGEIVNKRLTGCLKACLVVFSAVFCTTSIGKEAIESESIVNALQTAERPRTLFESTFWPVEDLLNPNILMMSSTLVPICCNRPRFSPESAVSSTSFTNIRVMVSKRPNMYGFGASWAIFWGV